MMNQRLFPAAVLILLLAASPAAIAQTTHIVTVGDNFFSPSSLTIAAGDTVRWVNAAGGMPHDVTSNSGAFPSSPTASSFTYEVTFNTPGQFGYFCTVHGNSMSGTITVQAAPMPEAEIELLSISVLNDGSVLQNTLQAGGNGNGNGNGNSGPQAFAQGDLIQIEAEIRNNGDAGSGDFSITYYASTNSSINVSDTSLGNFPVANLSAGATRTQQDQMAIPGSLPPGQYYIGAIVSYQDDNTSNNTNADNTPITIAGPFFINPGLNDVWATPGKNGQGILIAVFPDAEVFFSAWFTYDSTRPPDDATSELGEPDQRWVTMQGDFNGNTANLVVYISTGGVFDTAAPAPGDPIPIGTASIVFHDCGNATLSYEIPDLDLENTEPLVRIVGDNIPLCEEINNALQP